MRTRIAFTLTMPGRGSWDGKWSGEGRSYVRVRSYGDLTAARILSQKSYHYRWSDGWSAMVSVRSVDGRESRELTRKSNGFCGYEWMIDSIERHGKIYASHEEPAAEASA